MKEHNQFRLRLNLFDGIVLVLALAAAVFLMWRFTRPAAASGDTWPMDAPLVAPEKRPSVISATLSPSPMPAIVAVGLSISRIPGPPLGPS